MSKKLLNSAPMLMTIGNGLMGGIAIFLSLKGHYEYILFLILAASFLDTTDGWTARKMGISSRGGENADLFSDLISFGLAPALFIWKYFDTTSSIIVASLYLFAILFRLIRFRFGPGLEKGFIGVPSPIVALGAVAATSLKGEWGIPVNLLLLTIMIFSFFAISNFKFPKWGHPSLNLFPKHFSILIYIVHLIFFAFYPAASVLSMMVFYILIGAFVMIRHKQKEDALDGAGVS